MIRPHHQQTIDKLTAHIAADPAYAALIIGGSVAKGLARPDSDIDFILVATDEAYAERAAQNAFQYYSTDFSDYAGGYVDGKIVDLAFIQDVAARGSEPIRAAFEHAFITYSTIDALPDLLTRITTYPEDERERKLQTFYAQVQALQWYVGEAEKRGNRYLMMHVVSDLVLYGGRMILAHNRILYPYHKWFMTALDCAEDKPPELMALIDQLLETPTKQHADAFCEAVFSFTDWPQAPEGWPSRFMHEVEWAWRDGRAAVSDW